MNPYPCQAIIHRRKGHSIFQEMGFAMVNNSWSEAATPWTNGYAQPGLAVRPPPAWKNSGSAHDTYVHVIQKDSDSLMCRNTFVYPNHSIN